MNEYEIKFVIINIINPFLKFVFNLYFPINMILILQP